MNGNAPAFVPRQQQYMQSMTVQAVGVPSLTPPSLNIQSAQHFAQQQTIIQYDQFGAPYTSFHPIALNASNVPLPNSTSGGMLIFVFHSSPVLKWNVVINWVQRWHTT